MRKHMVRRLLPEYQWHYSIVREFEGLELSENDCTSTWQLAVKITFLAAKICELLQTPIAGVGNLHCSALTVLFSFRKKTYVNLIDYNISPGGFELVLVSSVTYKAQ